MSTESIQKPVYSELDQEQAFRIRANTHRVTSIEKLPPDVRFWALEEGVHRYSSGYEGSSLDSELNFFNITWFEDEEALEAWVIKATEDRKKFKIIVANPVKTEVRAVFHIHH